MDWDFHCTAENFVFRQSEQRLCMLDTVLHIGIEHPSALWILIPSLLSFITGLGFGIHSDRVQEWLRTHNTEATN